MAGRVERRLAAILAADVAGYSRLIGEDEEGALAALRSMRREVVDPQIAEHRGRIVKTTGDGLLVEFASVVDALRCAAAWQAAMPAESAIAWRIGINVGDIVVEDGDIFGDGVNVAARLEGLAEPGHICVSARVQEDASGRLALAFEDMGEQSLKNITRPVRVYRVHPTLTLPRSAWAPPSPASGRGDQQASPETPLPLAGEGAERQRGEAGEGHSSPALALPDKPSIAVLPFENMSGDPEQDYFADGMAEEIITALSRIRWLFVIARNSSFTYKGRPVDVKQVGRELGVRYVLEGSVRKGGNRVRITAQLIDAATGSHLWAERYDRDLTDVFALQDEITERVAAVIEPQLYAAEYVRSERKPPESLDAWECVVRALVSLARATLAGAVDAEALCRRAVSVSPGYGQAHSLLAWVLMRRAYLSSDLDAALPEAAQEVRAALMLDERDAWAHVAQGVVFFRMKRHGDAVTAYRQALECNANFALAHAELARALAAQGHHQAASESAAHAIRLSPGDPLVGGVASHTIVFAHFAAERYAEAIASAKAMIERYPEYFPAHYVLIAALGTTGDATAAAEAISRLRGLKPDFSMAWLLKSMPWTGEIGARLIGGWRQAGVPEE